MTTNLTAIRGQMLHFLSDPAKDGDKAWQYLEDGLMLIENGVIIGFGEAATLLPDLPATSQLHHYPDKLIMPGFIDTHIHYPQTEIIAAYGEKLLTWLENYTFPAEAKFEDPAHAQQIARFFLQELLKNGTTTALVFGTVHRQSVDAFFTEALEKNLRMIAGKVLMDRHVPDNVADTPQSGYDDSKALIEAWHNKGRLSYAITPRFAPTSTSEQLAMAGKLLQEYPDVYMQTHISEDADEIAWVKQLFPESEHYLDVYDSHNLLTRRSVFAHGIHLEENEYQRLGQVGAAIAHCPTSNLFLGSGLFNLPHMEHHDINISLATDIGGGTSFSLLQTISEAYKIQQLRGNKLDPFKSLYLATLGGAKALDLENTLGNFQPGKEADFIVTDLAATPLMAFRHERCNTLFEKLFVLTMLGDDRAIYETWSFGQRVHHRDSLAEGEIC